MSFIYIPDTTGGFSFLLRYFFALKKICLHFKSGSGVHTFNLSTQEAETGGPLRVQGQPCLTYQGPGPLGLHSETLSQWKNNNKNQA